MASERDLELLDDYIGNRLNGAEKNAFEQKLEGDPELSREYQLQNKIAEGIRKARATQLKAMLGAIPTPAIHGGSESSLLSKVGMWVAASAVIGAGVYFWLSSDDTQEKTPEPITQAPDTTTAVVETPATTNEAEEAPAQSTPTVVVPKQENQKPTVAKKDSGNANAPSAKPKIDAFDPSQEDSAGNAAASPEAVVAASDQPVTNKEQTQAEIVSDHKKFKFHYQFKHDKVILYGPFQANLYEIMEFFGGPQQTVFLFHNSAYYMMTNDGEKVKPLQPIKDPKLIKKLDESRQIK